MSGIVDRLIELRDKNRSNVKDGVPVNYGERLWLRPDGRVANDAIKEIPRLRAELAAKSKDAERYQWLRQLDNAFDFRKLPRTWSAAHTPEQLDDTIDAAMGEGNGR